MNSTRGFTLIEVMIALIIFAILASITASVMNQTLRASERLTQHMNALNEWQLALTYIEKDTQNIVDRPIRTNNMQIRASFIGNNHYIEFTRAGLINPANIAHRSTLQRLAYVCQQGQLIRRSWDVLDPLNFKQYHDKILLHDLSTCSCAFLDQTNQITTTWQATQDFPYPRAIQMTLDKNMQNKSSFLWSLRL